MHLRNFKKNLSFVIIFSSLSYLDTHPHFGYFVIIIVP